LAWQESSATLFKTPPESTGSVKGENPAPKQFWSRSGTFCPLRLFSPLSLRSGPLVLSVSFCFFFLFLGCACAHSLSPTFSRLSQAVRKPRSRRAGTPPGSPRARGQRPSPPPAGSALISRFWGEGAGRAAPGGALPSPAGRRGGALGTGAGRPRLQAPAPLGPGRGAGPPPASEAGPLPRPACSQPGTPAGPT
jgi:hypothetical protein